MNISFLPSSFLPAQTAEVTFSSDFDSTAVEFEFHGEAADLLGFGPACCGVTVRKSRSGDFIAKCEKAGIRVTRI